MHIVGIAGSLRAGSYNRNLLIAARELAPEGARVELFDLSEVPLYNADLDNDENRPDAVVALKEAIANSDGVLFATPEYNHGVPGVLKNAIDWASRPGLRSPMAGKAMGIMGAAPGVIGTARAQEQLKLVLESTLALVMPHRGVVVGGAKDRFDGDGRLSDETTRQFVAAYLKDLAAWIRRMAATSSDT